MQSFFYVFPLLLPSVFIFLFFCLVVKNKRNLPSKQRIVLDRVGLVTNILLAILYIPVSVTGFFFGMVGEAFIHTGTSLQLAICDFVGYLGIATPVAAYGGLIVSVILRKFELSLHSFLYQFSGLIYLLFLYVLSLIPFCL